MDYGLMMLFGGWVFGLFALVGFMASGPSWSKYQNDAFSISSLQKAIEGMEA